MLQAVATNEVFPTAEPNLKATGSTSVIAKARLTRPFQRRTQIFFGLFTEMIVPEFTRINLLV
jgi:hypothetical protein